MLLFAKYSTFILYRVYAYKTCKKYSYKKLFVPGFMYTILYIHESTK